MAGDESRPRRSPSPVELIDRPPTIFRPPSRTLSSPPLTAQEIDELTNPNLPYRTSYTYADSIIYRSKGPEYYLIPNMAGGGRYHHLDVHNNHSETRSWVSSTTTWMTEEVRYIYIRIIDFFAYSLRGAANGGKSISSIFMSILYFIIYGILTVAQYTVDGAKKVGSAIAYPLLYPLRSQKPILRARAVPLRRERRLNFDSEIDTDDDEVEPVQIVQRQQVAAASRYDPFSSIRRRLGWAAVHHTTEPVYELRSRTVEREIELEDSANGEMPSSSTTAAASAANLTRRVHFEGDRRASPSAAQLSHPRTRQAVYAASQQSYFPSIKTIYDTSISFFKYPFVLAGSAASATANAVSTPFVAMKNYASRVAQYEPSGPIVEEPRDDEDDEAMEVDEEPARRVLLAPNEAVQIRKRVARLAGRMAREETPQSVFSHVGGVGWAVKESVQTVAVKSIDAVYFLAYFLRQILMALYEFVASGASVLHELVTGAIWLVLVSASVAVSTIYNGLLGVAKMFTGGASESASVVKSSALAAGAGVASLARSTRRALTGNGWCSRLFWFLLVPLLLLALLFIAYRDPNKTASEHIDIYARGANSIIEDYYKTGSHYTVTYWDALKINFWAAISRIGDGLRMFLQLFLFAVYGIHGFFMDSMAALNVDRLFKTQQYDALIPPPVVIPPPLPSECPPPPPPVIIREGPSLDVQEQMVAAVVAKVSASFEKRLSERFDAVEETVNKAKLELYEQASVSAANVNIDYSALDIMIREALRKYDADKTGQPDYALESAGGAVVSTRCSETYPLATRLEKIFNIPLYYSSYGPRVVIQRNAQGLVPGECWAFKGGIGYLTIKLAHPIRVTAVSYEHIPGSLQPSGETKSAPKAFSIFAYENDENDFASRTLLGNFTYDNSSEPLQIFPIETVPRFPVHYIELQIESNWGEDYTCLYRFRVHGHLLTVANPK